MSESKPRFVAAGYHVFDTIDSPAVTVAECLPGGEDGQGWARRVADALNDSIEYPWIDEAGGPSVAEAGGESILVRDPVSGDLEKAKWNHTLREWISQTYFASAQSPHARRPAGWRRMPPAHDATRKT